MIPSSNNSSLSHKKGFAIAIDGPVASGKGTVSRDLVKKTGGVNFYTGGMYRALALKCNRLGVGLEDTEKVLEILKNSSISVAEKEFSDFSKIVLDGKDVSDEILAPDAAMGASIVSQIEEVREVMVSLQKEMAQRKIDEGKMVVMEGRDIGTKVLPDAQVKIFLTASVEIRAQRRLEQYEEKGVAKDFNEVIEEIKKRDSQDSNRRVDPLVKDPENYGYYILDNSNLPRGGTVEKIIELLKTKGFIN